MSVSVSEILENVDNVVCITNNPSPIIWTGLSQDSIANALLGVTGNSSSYYCNIPIRAMTSIKLQTLDEYTLATTTLQTPFTITTSIRGVSATVKVPFISNDAIALSNIDNFSYIASNMECSINTMIEGLGNITIGQYLNSMISRTPDAQSYVTEAKKITWAYAFCLQRALGPTYTTLPWNVQSLPALRHLVEFFTFSDHRTGSQGCVPSIVQDNLFGYGASPISTNSLSLKSGAPLEQIVLHDVIKDLINTYNESTR